MFRNVWESLVNFVVEKIIGPVRWDNRDPVTEEQKFEIEKRLVDDYYIIVTRRKTHLSTFFINLGHWFLTFKWGFYTHVLMNLEDEVASPEDFRLIEAVGVGTKYSTLDEILVDVDSIALLKPVSMTLDDWTAAMDRAKQYLYTPYDTLFDLKTDYKISCVELIRLAMQAVPDYGLKFANFEKMIADNRNLTPQMFLDCPDFHIVYEIRNK